MLSQQGVVTIDSQVIAISRMLMVHECSRRALSKTVWSSTALTIVYRLELACPKRHSV